MTTSTSAENFWDEGAEEEAECERFLQNRKTKIIEDEENAVSDEYDEDEEDEEDEEDDLVVEVQDEADDEVTDDEKSEEAEEPADTEENADDSETAAEADDSAEAASTVKETKMVKTRTKTGGKTKAEAIREVITRRQRAGVSLRPKDIIEELSDNGFEVNASQVSVTLRNMGVPPAPKGRVKGSKMKPAATAAAPETKSRMAQRRGVSEEKAVAAHDGEVSDPAAMVDMAVEFMAAAGGYAKAVSILDSISRISG